MAYSQDIEEITDDDLIRIAPTAQQSQAASNPPATSPVRAAKQQYSQIADEYLSQSADAERAAGEVEAARSMAGQVSHETADKASEENEDMRADMRAQKARIAQLDKETGELLEKYNDPIVKPERWQKILSGVVRVVGAIGAGSGSAGGQGLAAAMGLLDEKINQEALEQLQSRAETGKKIEANEGILGKLHERSRSAAELSGMYTSAIYREGAARAEAYAADAKTAEEALQYRTLAKGLEISASKALIDGHILQRDEDARVRAGRSQGNPVKMSDVFGSMSIAQLENAAANPGPHQVAAAERLAEFQSKTQAVTKGKEPAPAPPGTKIKDPSLWNSIGDTERAKYRLAKSSLDSYNRDSKKLSALIDAHGTEAFGPVAKEMEALKTSLLGSYKEIKELGALDTGVIELTDRAHGDPNSFFGTGENVKTKLKTTLDSLNAGFRERERGLGLAPTLPPEEDQRILVPGRFDADPAPKQVAPTDPPRKSRREELGLSSPIPAPAQQQPQQPTPHSAAVLAQAEIRRRQHQAWLSRQGRK